MTVGAGDGDVGLAIDPTLVCRDTESIVCVINRALQFLQNFHSGCTVLLQLEQSSARLVVVEISMRLFPQNSQNLLLSKKLRLHLKQAFIALSIRFLLMRPLPWFALL